MSYDRPQAVAALDVFQREKGLKDFPWERASGVGEGTLRRFRKGANRAMSNETYEKLAAGAAKLLGEPIVAAQLREPTSNPAVPTLASAPPGSLVQNPKGRPVTIASHHVVWDRFVKFARKEGLTLGRIAQAAGLPPSAASEPTGPYSEQVETLKKLAKAATKLLKRPVPLDDLLVEQHAGEVPVRSYVGAGDEIIPFDDEEPLYWTAPPPELEGECEATQVRGTSMLPAYEDGDVLFHRRHDDDPTRFLGRVVILQTRSRKRYVKVLQAGTKKGHFDLVSFNRLSPTIENQQLLWVAPILWVKKRQTV